MKRRLCLPLATIAVGLLGLVPPATSSAAVGPILNFNSAANTAAAPGSAFTYFLRVTDVGDQETDGSPITFQATLPPGLIALSATPEGIHQFDCSATSPPLPAQTVTCEFTEEMAPAPCCRRTEIEIEAEAEEGAEGILTTTYLLTGGGAPPVSSADPTSITEEPLGFGIDAFDQQVTDPTGAPFTQAASHPADVSTEIDFNTSDAPRSVGGTVDEVWPVSQAKNAFVDLPVGLVGDPSISARCSAVDLAAGGSDADSLCPAASQVGVATVAAESGQLLGNPFAVYNMVPPLGVAARFGFDVAGTVVLLDASVRAGGGYGLTVGSRGISEGLAIAGTRLTFWGVPADPSHDFQRACPGGGPPGEQNNLTATQSACAELAKAQGLPVPPYTRPDPEQAFLRNPTSCTAPGQGLTTTLHTDSWFNPGAVNSDGSPDLTDPAWVSASTTSHEAPGYPYPPSEWGDTVGIEGCEEVPFEPEISVAPTTNQADSPSGLEVDLSVPQNALAEPEAVAQSDLEGARVTLPEGMSVNPAQANGLGGCSAAQIDLHGENTEPSCPNSSRIGEVSITTPLLDHPIEGSVYLAAQNDNPFNSLIALYIVGDDLAQTGTVIKLAGEVRANQSTGQLETVFTDQPQLPFETLHLSLFGGSHAALITPPACGTYTTQSSLSPWSGNPPAELQSSFQITAGPSGSPCPPKPAAFNPTLSSGTQSPTAGAYSPFSLRLTRADAEQRFASLSATLPPGLIGKLAGIPYCPEAALASIPTAEGTAAAQLASPACPAASQLGTVSVGAGAGPDPFFLQTARAYLAGPYKGAPLSLAIVTPALAGPFDLGNVLVRTALKIDPDTAQITATSDPLPQILDGIPLDLRDLRVDINRPNFTLNPTSCDPTAVEATVSGSEGASANLSNRFQVGECGRLAFKPKLTLRLKGKTKRSGHPALRATLTMPSKTANANIAKAVVSLPHSEFLAQSHIRTICTRVQYAAGSGGGEQCPKGSVYGHAKAISPLLDQPLQGPVYLRSSSHPLPDLVASLGGQIHIDLLGRIDSVNGGIRNTFDLVPDAPVSKFTLTMQGGKKGLLENSRDICAHENRATALFDGHNGKIADSRPELKADCGGKAKHRNRARPAH